MKGSRTRGRAGVAIRASSDQAVRDHLRSSTAVQRGPRHPAIAGLACFLAMVAAACGDGATEPSALANRAPAPTGAVASRAIAVGETSTVDVSGYFADPDGDALTYAAASSNPGVASAAVVGSVVTITAVARGEVTVTVTATDSGGGQAQQGFSVTVPNRTPEAVAEIPAQTVNAGQAVALDMAEHFSDPDGDALTFLAETSDPGVAVVVLAGTVVTVTGVLHGEATVTVTARDVDGTTAQQSFEVTVPNRTPEAVGTIPNQSIATGETVTLDASTYFTDPDGDSLSFTATSSNAGVAAASTSGASVVVSALARGVATITVTARDSSGLSAIATFEVSVSASPDGFRIDLVFASSVTATQEAAFRGATERWMTVLAATELPDLEAQSWSCGDDPRFEWHAAIDDVMIVAVVEEIDGPGGTLAQAGTCWVRHASQLPIYGRMIFDTADLEGQERVGNMEQLVLHEMGHVLGIGIIWEDLELLRNPASEEEAPDTYFTGPLAIEAFDDAGGTGYGGAKVPVENTGGAGTRNSHWRETVMQTELMTGWSEEGNTEPLSTITIQSLADLGYAVDATAADPYRLPHADAARKIDKGRLIPYGNDIWRGPIIVADSAGRVVRVIRPR